MSPALLNVGIAGLGRLGKRHAEQLARNTPGARLLSACSPVQSELEWARTALGVTRCHSDLQDMLNDPDVHAVVLVTPTTLHAEQAMACLHAGKHVFVEKPLSLDLSTCEAVEAVAKQYPQQVAMVGFVRRFDPSYAEAKAAIDKGTLGHTFLVRSQTCDQNDESGFFVRFAESSGGIFMDCSVHDIDLARWLMGNPKATRVFASGTTAIHHDLKQHADVDNGLAIVEFEGGQRAVLYASRTMPHGHETTTEVIGTKGTLQVGVGAHLSRVQYRDASGVGHRALPDFFARFDTAFHLEMNAFVAACRGEQTVPLTLSDATEATRIGQALRASLASGLPVNL
jgi:myo-inositol 2-dehydrogenase / D-chiro-inositol 1-dehydrogenase